MDISQNPDCEQSSDSHYPRIWAIMINERHHDILVYQQPAVKGKPTRVSLGQLFILNNNRDYTWKITDVDYHNTDQDYVTYMVHGVNDCGWFNIVIPREWSNMKDVEERLQDIQELKKLNILE
jgi:hypothetical protein